MVLPERGCLGLGQRKKMSRCWLLRRRPVTEVTTQQDKMDFNHSWVVGKIKLRRIYFLFETLARKRFYSFQNNDLRQLLKIASLQETGP
jgi:hypothetical protein